MSAPEIVNVTPSMMYTPGLVIVYDPGPQVSSAKSSPLVVGPVLVDPPELESSVWHELERAFDAEHCGQDMSTTPPAAKASKYLHGNVS
jgi:hypothetical protein